MKRDERLGEILALLARDGRIDVDGAAGTLGVSLATLRRDLDHLAGKNLLTRTHGGALPNGTSYELPLRYRGARGEQKRRIAIAVAESIPSGAVVGLNGGTTCAEVARALGERSDLAEAASTGQPAITVVTNAVNLAAELAIRSHIKLVLTGGVCRTASYELVGPLAETVLDSLALDVAVVGVDGVTAEAGAFATNESEAAINRALLSAAARVVVPADSGKLGRKAFARICPVADIDEIVTDADATDEQVAEFDAAGVVVRRT